MTRLRGSLFGLIVSCLVAVAPHEAAAQDGARLVVFGDSLSDSGNNPAPSPPYFASRWSNGFTYADRLAPSFDMGEFLTPSSIPGGTNYAHGGARIGGDDGVIQQIAAYLHDVRWRVDRRTVHVVLVGANDILDGLAGALTTPSFDPAAFVDRRLAALGIALTAFSALGARHLVILNIPDLSKLPGLPPEIMPLAAFMSQRFNTGLERIAWLLARARVNATLVRVSTLFDAILADAAEGGARFGITNVAAPCLIAVAGVPPSLCANPDAYLFWDGLHPTARAHDILSDFIVESLTRHRFAESAQR